MLACSSGADQKVYLLKKMLNKILPSLFCFSNEADFCLYPDHGIEERRREVAGMFCLETAPGVKAASDTSLPVSPSPWQQYGQRIRIRISFLCWLLTSFLIIPLVLSLWWGERGFPDARTGTQMIFLFFFLSIIFPLWVDMWEEMTIWYSGENPDPPTANRQTAPQNQSGIRAVGVSTLSSDGQQKQDNPPLANLLPCYSSQTALNLYQSV